MWWFAVAVAWGADWTPAWSAEVPEVHGLAISPDGDVVAIGGRTATLLSGRDGTPGASVRTCAAWDGAFLEGRLALRCDDHLELVDLATGRTGRGPSGARLTALDAGPAGVIVHRSSGDIELYALPDLTPRVVATLPSKHTVQRLVWTGPHTAAVGTYGSGVHEVDVTDGSVRKITGKGKNIQAMDALDDGTLFVAIEPDRGWLWGADGDRRTILFDGFSHAAAVLSGSQVAVGASEGLVISGLPGESIRLFQIDAVAAGHGLVCAAGYKTEADGRKAFFGDPDTPPTVVACLRDAEMPPPPVSAAPAVAEVPPEPEPATLKRRSGDTLVITLPAGQTVSEGQHVLHEIVERSFGGGSLKMVVELALVELVSQDGVDVALRIVEERGQIQVNGQKVDRFKPGKPVRLD